MPPFTGQDSGAYCAATINATVYAPDVAASILSGGLPALAASVDAAVPSMAVAASLAPPELQAAHAVALPAMQTLAATLPALVAAGDMPGITADLAAVNAPTVAAAGRRNVFGLLRETPRCPTMQRLPCGCRTIGSSRCSDTGMPASRFPATGSGSG